MANYHPLGGHSPSLQPSLGSGDLANNEQFDLEERRSNSRPHSPEEQQATDYNSYRHNRYNQPPDDIENQHLIKQEQAPPTQFRLYKRRWFGLAELSLLSFAIGWSFTAASVVAETAVVWYDITFPELNNLSIASSLAFLAPAAVTIWVLNKFGPKWSLVVSAILIVIGDWVIYAGAATHNFKINIAGTVIHSLAMPFALCAPTRYSRQWFGDSGRTLATAIPSLAYPMGAATGALSGKLINGQLGPPAAGDVSAARVSIPAYRSWDRAIATRLHTEPRFSRDRPYLLDEMSETSANLFAFLLAGPFMVKPIGPLGKSSRSGITNTTLTVIL